MGGVTRRRFLGGFPLAAAAASLVPYFPWSRRSLADLAARSANERPRFGAIGVGGRGRAIARQAQRFADLVAIADVDLSHAEQARDRLTGGKADIYQDYRKLLDRKDIDLVVIGTPDHWHTKICVEALLSGRDVYCEKPLTLTVEEGQILCRVLRQTDRVFQVGTQQRSEFANRFLTAVAICRLGRLGRIKRVTCAIGGAPKGGPFQKSQPPDYLDWDMWLGQAPYVDYIKERSHGTFRWWYEYSGGKVTDWGAHHVDIAHWAIGMEHTGPLMLEVLEVEHPVPFKNGYPTVDDSFNTATRFNVRCVFSNGVELFIRHSAKELGFGNGIQIEGENGSIFVNRGQLRGEPVDDLQKDPIPEEVYRLLRKGKPLGPHMENFFLCLHDRSEPVSDVYTHHRALTTCHLANIALRLGRNLRWDPETEQIIGDEEAASFLGRKQRKGYEIVA